MLTINNTLRNTLNQCKPISSEGLLEFHGPLDV